MKYNNNAVNAFTRYATFDAICNNTDVSPHASSITMPTEVISTVLEHKNVHVSRFSRWRLFGFGVVDCDTVLFCNL